MVAGFYFVSERSAYFILDIVVWREVYRRLDDIHRVDRLNLVTAQGFEYIGVM